MALYLVQHAGQTDYVEAKDYTAALKAWMTSSWGRDFQGEEPESIARLTNDPVIR